MTNKFLLNRTRWLHSALCTLILLFTLGVGNMWSTDYQLIKSTDDLVAGAHYVLGAYYSSSYYFAKTDDNTNNRKLVTATVTNEKVSSVTGLMTFTLGGNSTNGWTFATDNYAGTAGYLNATSTTSSSTGACTSGATKEKTKASQQ